MIKIIFPLLLSLLVFANEGGEAPPAENHGGGEAGAAPSADQKAQKELQDVEKQVAGLAAKIKAKNDSIEHLLTQKNIESDAEKTAELVKLVQQEHRELKTLTSEYNTQLGILQYRFPERGLNLQRRYQRLDTKSIDEMEKNLGLDAHLKKSRDKIKTVYGVSEKPAPKKEGTEKRDRISQEPLVQPSVLSK
jgi:hypothetical protein